MRKYIIALTIDLPENMPPERWLSARIGSVQLKDVNVHIEEVKNLIKMEKKHFLVVLVQSVLKVKNYRENLEVVNTIVL